MLIAIVSAITIVTVVVIAAWSFFTGVLQARLYYRDPTNKNCRFAAKIIRFCDEEDAARGKR
jgi:hypothetical protein